MTMLIESSRIAALLGDLIPRRWSSSPWRSHA